MSGKNNFPVADSQESYFEAGMFKVLLLHPDTLLF